MSQISGPCFAHFQINCKICFPKQKPTATPPEDDKNTIQPVPEEPKPESDANVNKNNEKRKAANNYKYPIKKKKAIIDCPVAQKIFRGLRLTNKFFNSGTLLAWALPPDDPAYKYIYQYVERGQEHGYGIKIQSVLRVVSNAQSIEQEEAPVDFNDDPGRKEKLRMMLWHGTKRNCVSSILQNGLRLPPLSFLVRTLMFGEGIYFADRISKSIQYCSVLQWEGLTAYLFLSDVLLGQIYKCETGAMPELTGPPINFPTFWNPYNSVMGCGRDIPDEAGNIEHEGSVWPIGRTLSNEPTRMHRPLKFNEYVVYDTDQVIPKYLVKVELTEKPYYETVQWS